MRCQGLSFNALQSFPVSLTQSIRPLKHIEQNSLRTEVSIYSAISKFGRTEHYWQYNSNGELHCRVLLLFRPWIPACSGISTQLAAFKLGRFLSHRGVQTQAAEA